jgi:hypothetical protein
MLDAIDIVLSPQDAGFLISGTIFYPLTGLSFEYDPQ